MKLIIPPELELVDNLTSIDTDKALTANQGKELKTHIDTINALLTSDESTLDTLQEVVDYIETNRSTLNALGISNISGLQAALNAKIATADIEDNLTSTLTNKPLSANQGKALKDLVDTKEGSLTFGIGDTNAVKIDSTAVTNNEYAVFTSNGLKSLSGSEVVSDLGVGGSSYTLPTASSTTLGGVKVGDTLGISNGVLNVANLIYSDVIASGTSATLYTNSSDGFTFKWNSSANQITVASAYENTVVKNIFKIDGNSSSPTVRYASDSINATGTGDYFLTGGSTSDSDWDMEVGAYLSGNVIPYYGTSYRCYKIEATKSASVVVIQIWRI